jgi:hypothetical protein
MKHTKHLTELGYTIVAEPQGHHVDYTVYEVVATDMDGKLFWGGGECGMEGMVETLEDAEPYLHGSVKWDGCSNWHFDEQDRVMLHGCSRANVVAWGEVMAACWDWTRELCPAWSSVGLTK